MKADGTIDEAVARSKVPKDIPKDKVDQVINSCKIQGRFSHEPFIL